MKRKGNVLAAVLALCLILGLMPTEAIATGPLDSEVSSFSENLTSVLSDVIGESVDDGELQDKSEEFVDADKRSDVELKDQFDEHPSEERSGDWLSDDVIGSDSDDAEKISSSSEYGAFNPFGNDSDTPDYVEDDVESSNTQNTYYSEPYETSPYVTLMAEDQPNVSADRYMVLVLDTSSSQDFLDENGVFYTADTAIEYVKASAKKFIDDVIKAKGVNHVAIVSFSGSGATTVSGFSTDLESLKSSIEDLAVSQNNRNVAAGLQRADTLISGISDLTALKNVVLFTTGMTDAGSYSYTGHYDSNTIASNWRRMDTQVRLYAYANVAYSTAETLKEKANLYTIGLFQVMDDMPSQGRDVVNFFKLSASEWATSPDYFYDVKDPQELEFVFGEVANDILGHGDRFKYAGAIVEDRDSSAKYSYSDSYFFGDPKIYNPSLSTMSLCLELSTFSSSEKEEWFDPNLTVEDSKYWNDKLINIKTLLLGSRDSNAVENGYGGIGFHDFMANDFWERTPTTDSIGVIAARKTIKRETDGKEYTLIALVVRGGGYGSEWASNFTIGTSGEHQGFGEAKTHVLEFLRDVYLPRISDSEPHELKIWITGYSRGAATANMVAGELDKGFNINKADTTGNLTLTEDNIFCYTFETPMGILENEIDSEGYRNIHNIRNLNDVVPYVAPFAWGFNRYGYKYDWILPTKSTAAHWRIEYNAMINEFEKLGYDSDLWYAIEEASTHQNLKIDKSKWFPGGDPLWWWEDSSMETRSVIMDSVDLLAQDVIGSREYYNQNLQSGVRQIMDEYGSGRLDGKKLKHGFEQLTEKDNVKYMLKPIFSLNPFYSFNDRMNDSKNRMVEKLREYFSEYADNEGFMEAIVDICWSVLSKVASDAWNNNTDSVNLVLKMVDLGTTKTTMIDGESVEKKTVSLANAHFPEVCLAWLRSQDPNFNKSTELDSVNSGITRKVHINCPVDVEVFDGSGNKVAEITNNVVTLDEFVIAQVNDKGEKILYLPGDEEYTVNLTATEQGEVYYSVDEINYLLGTATRLVNFNRVEINEGESLKGIVPKIDNDELLLNDEDGSTVAYLFQDSNSQNVDYEESTGDEVQYYSVTLNTEGNGGFVYGAGNFLKGNFAQVEAGVLPGSEFHGWYDNENSLVSEDLIYRFPVNHDINLSAKFSDVDFHKLSFVASTGGHVTNTEDYYSEGIEITLEATPEDGYEFVNWSSSNGGELSDFSSEHTTFLMPGNEVVITANFKRVDSDEYTIAFDANGGSVSTAEASTVDGHLSTLPVPTRGNHTFVGWFTSSNGGTQVTTNTVFSEDTTIYAHWAYYSGGGSGGGGGGRSTPSYSISVANNITGGQITASAKTARSGSTITLTVVPSTEYELDVLTVTTLAKSDSSRSISTDRIAEGKYTFTMPSSNVLVEASFKLLPEVPSTDDTDKGNTDKDNQPSYPSTQNPFDDVIEGSYYYEAVLWAVENGVTKGNTATTFGPALPCTRGHAVTFLWRAAGSPIPTLTSNPFTDITPGTYYYNAVLWAVENGITNGKTATTFDPNGVCTRGQIVTFLYRSAKESPPSVTSNFSDVSKTAYYYDAVNWAAYTGVTLGTTASTFSPGQPCTRGQIVTFLYRYYV